MANNAQMQQNYQRLQKWKAGTKKLGRGMQVVGLTWELLRCYDECEKDPNYGKKLW